jgi:hypothetical protein
VADCPVADWAVGNRASRLIRTGVVGARPVSGSPDRGLEPMFECYGGMGCVR